MAEILGISEVHLGRLAKAGTLPEPLARGEWDVVAVVGAYIAYVRKQVGEGGDAGDAEMKSEELKLLTARRRRAEANAIADEIEAEHARRAVVFVAEAEAAMASFCQVLKTGLGNASSRIASRATTMTSAVEIQDLAESELNRAFSAAQADLQARWAYRDDAGDDGAEPPV